MRITRNGQLGYRKIRPFSLRIGWFGRRLPVQLETKDEIGIGPKFRQSPAREVCMSELGVGFDLIGGLYGGVCLEEVADFVTGIFLVDLLDDDI
jgi:hypothetical protein